MTDAAQWKETEKMEAVTTRTRILIASALAVLAPATTLHVHAAGEANVNKGVQIGAKCRLSPIRRPLPPSPVNRYQAPAHRLIFEQEAEDVTLLSRCTQVLVLCLHLVANRACAG
jgi:hypothetical protein